MEHSDESSLSWRKPAERKRSFATPRWLVGILAAVCLTFLAGFYLPQKNANDKLMEQFARLSHEYHLAIGAFETKSQDLASLKQERDGLKDNLGQIDQAESAAKNALNELHKSIEESLKLQIERRQVRVKKREKSVVIIIDGLYLMYPHKTFVHARGAQLLCQVARAIPKNTGHPTQVVAHANGAKPWSQILEKQFATSWQLSAILASEVTAEIANCGTLGTELRAVGAAHFEGDPDSARKSPARFEIFVYPEQE